MFTNLIDKKLNILSEAVKTYTTMMLNEQYHNFIFNRLELTQLQEQFELTNRSKDLPYHNNYHAYCMVKNCYEGAQHSEYTLSKSDLRVLITAALFHDYQHSGGKQGDEVNVQTACDEFYLLYWNGVNSSNITQWLSLDEFYRVERLIKITEYPYKEEPLTVLEQIIRDADLMQIYEAHSPDLLKQFLGLKQEIDLSTGIESSVVNFAKKCKEFQLNIQWNTKWAQDKSYLLQFLDRVDHLQRLLIGTT